MYHFFPFQAKIINFYMYVLIQKNIKAGQKVFVSW